MNSIAHESWVGMEGEGARWAKEAVELEGEDAVDAKGDKRPILCECHIVVLVPILVHVKPRRQQWTLR
jgi:hypothetical protein